MEASAAFVSLLNAGHHIDPALFNTLAEQTLGVGDRARIDKERRELGDRSAGDRNGKSATQTRQTKMGEEKESARR